MKNEMLASVVLCLRAVQTCNLPQTIGNIVHAQLLGWIQEKDCKLSSRWHNLPDLKPFSISPIIGKFAKASTGKVIVKNQLYWLKIGLLQKKGFDILSDVLFPLAARQAAIKIGQIPFVLEEIKLEGHPWARVSGWHELIFRNGRDSNNDGNTFLLRFLTPTTFRRGDINRILPDPELVFGSLLDRWNAYAPTKYPLELKQRFTEEVVVSRIAIRSDSYSLKHQSLIGFLGSCVYSVISNDRELVDILKNLSALAIYSGVGQKTTMGMGVCRAVN
ncbi:MAG: CRISPR-associated endoribonuclease Cas6 [Actinobacteria bacterium]|nr:CRISPR-associated endoribonuclease Cas6 [Actinomycetota bacterium]